MFLKTFEEHGYEYYNLDPCHYISSPGLAWSACLKITGIELELISDIDMYLFIEKGLRRMLVGLDCILSYIYYLPRLFCEL